MQDLILAILFSLVALSLNMPVLTLLCKHYVEAESVRRQAPCETLGLLFYPSGFA